MGWGGEDVRLLDLFYKGGETIRGFDRAGFGPRDLLTGDALGGDTFWATTAEVRFPLPFVPEDLGMSGAVFVDAGSLFGAGARPRHSTRNAALPGRAIRNGVCLADTRASARRPASACCGTRRWVRCVSTSPRPLKQGAYDNEQLIRFGASTKF